MTETNYRNWIGWIAGTVQTVLYLDFFYYYAVRYILGVLFICSKWFGKKMSLPT